MHFWNGGGNGFGISGLVREVSNVSRGVTGGVVDLMMNARS